MVHEEVERKWREPMLGLIITFLKNYCVYKYGSLLVLVLGVTYLEQNAS